MEDGWVKVTFYGHTPLDAATFGAQLTERKIFELARQMHDVFGFNATEGFTIVQAPFGPQASHPIPVGWPA